MFNIWREDERWQWEWHAVTNLSIKGAYNKTETYAILSCHKTNGVNHHIYLMKDCISLELSFDLVLRTQD